MDEHTTGWERLAEAAAKKLEGYGPRANGRRARDHRSWWGVTALTALLQGGAFTALYFQQRAWERSLAEERKLRAEQHIALVDAMKAQTETLKQLATAVQANTEADAATRAIVLDRAGRGGGR